MSSFRFFHPIEVRYADIDAQGHVNNVCYFTYMETARARYVQQLGLWDGRDFFEFGIILADAHCTFKAAIRYGQAIRVGVRTARLGNSSLELNYSIQDVDTSQEMATGVTVLVAYDYHQGKSIPIPETWRIAIEGFESLG